MTIERLVRIPLGMVPFEYGNPKKGWVGTAIGAAAGLASSLIGGASSASAARKAARQAAAERAREDAWYRRRYNEDYADTAAGQTLIRKARELADERWKRAEGARAVAGGTDASVAQAKDSANRMIGETLSNIGAADTSRKAAVDAAHRSADARLTARDVAIENQRAQNITTASQNASNAIMQGASAFDLQGGSNKGTQVAGTFTPGTDDMPADRMGATAVGDVTGNDEVGPDYYVNLIRQ